MSMLAVEESMQVVAEKASSDIARAVLDVATDFVASGGYGSLRMHLAGNRIILQTFRSAAVRMALAAKRSRNHATVRDLLESHLSMVVDRTIADRTSYLRAANLASHESDLLSGSLLHDMKRLKDTAVRNFTLDRSRAADAPGGSGGASATPRGEDISTRRLAHPRALAGIQSLSR